MNVQEEKQVNGDLEGDAANKERKRWKKFLASARQMMAQNNYGKSLSYFAYVIHHSPSLRNDVHDDFLFALTNWSRVLEEHGRVEDLVKCLNEARKLFPNSAEVSNTVGSVLFRLNLFDEAAAYFRRALTLDPGLSGVQENLDSVANLLVERWHFRMLNDRSRNLAYKRAIERAVRRGCDRVLDIGTGTGILSMFAVQSGAKEVFACEMSKTMFDLSSDILEANSMRDAVHVINKRSCDLKIPDDLPERVSLVVTETLDCGLLGEGILETLTHARRELFKADGIKTNSNSPSGMLGRDTHVSQVIPLGATVYGRIVQSEKIRRYSRVKAKILDLDLGGVNIKGAEFSEKSEEPYTTEEMSCIEHTRLSETFHVMTYDFRAPERYIPESELRIKVPVGSSGSVDAVMTWFELNLDSFETISSSPGCSICWEQAVYPCSGRAGREHHVEAGDEVVLRCKLTSGAIFLQVDHVVRKDDRMIKEDNRVVEEDFESTTEDDEQNQTYVFPFPEISKLNDTRFHENFRAAIFKAFSVIRSVHSQDKCPKTANSGCLILCDAPTFNPLFAAASGFSQVLCIGARNTDFANCLEALRESNRIPDTIRFTEGTLEELASCGRWEVLVVDPVEPSGAFRRGVLEDVVFAKGCVLAKDTGLVLPGKIELWGTLISSESLRRKSQVIGDDVTLGLDIAPYMNAFQVRNHIDVDINSNPYTAFTRPRRLLVVDFTTPTDDDKGDDSLLSLLQVTREVQVTTEQEGCVDGLMYWFVMCFSEQRKLSTGPDSGSHFNQVVIVFKDKMAVSRGEELLITSSCKNSCVTASVRRVVDSSGEIHV